MGFLRAVELPIIGYNGMIQDVRGDEIVAVFESEPDAVRAGLGDAALLARTQPGAESARL